MLRRGSLVGAIALACAIALGMNCKDNSTSPVPPPKPLQLLQPTGSENFKVGSTQVIKWIINDKLKIGSVKVELSLDAGISFLLPLGGRSFSYPDTSYSWTVDSSQVSNQCLIVVSEYNERSINDQSGIFSVTK
jgi:hypothetical protein